MASMFKKGQDPEYDDGKLERDGSEPNAPEKPMSAFFCFAKEERSAVKAMYPGYNVDQIYKELGERWMTCPNKSKFEALADKEIERYEAEMAEHIRKQNGSDAIAKRDPAEAGEAVSATKRGSESKPPTKKKMASKSKKGQDPDYDGGKRKRGGRTCRRDSYAPKKPMSAFFWFIEEERPVVKAKYPDYNGCQMAKKLGESWMTCPNKSKFEVLAAKDRERYEAELAEYIRTQNISDAIAKKALAKAGKAAPATRRGSKSKPPAKKATVDDDGDDDDEEEIEEGEEVKEEEKSD